MTKYGSDHDQSLGWIKITLKWWSPGHLQGVLGPSTVMGWESVTVKLGFLRTD
jgi:hypothetical protein